MYLKNIYSNVTNEHIRSNSTTRREIGYTQNIVVRFYFNSNCTPRQISFWSDVSSETIIRIGHVLDASQIFARKVYCVEEQESSLDYGTELTEYIFYLFLPISSATMASKNVSNVRKATTPSHILLIHIDIENSNGGSGSGYTHGPDLGGQSVHQRRLHQRIFN